MSANRKSAALLKDRDDADSKLTAAVDAQQLIRAELSKAMVHAWRSMLREPVRRARAAAADLRQAELSELTNSLRRQAIVSRHCEVCDQDISTAALERLKALHGEGTSSHSSRVVNSRSLATFDDTDNTGEVRQIWTRLQEKVVEEKNLRDQISDLTNALKDANPESIRSAQATYAEILERIGIAKTAIEGEQKKIEQSEADIQRLRDKIRVAKGGSPDAFEARARLLSGAAEVFRLAVESYKADLKTRVEASATQLFLEMTTEPEDYVGLRINDAYGLSILHQDGQAEEARSAGAEHVVALALMGALQQNAPLTGPIVMDSPFGRLDDLHTSNVVRTLDQMAKQVVLLVYESEVGRTRARELLGKHLAAEYELVRINSRRTEVRQVKNS